MVCSKTILELIVPKEGKTHDPKKIKALVRIPMPKHLRRFKSSMEWPNFIDVSLEILLLLWH
jgi:hypothetical protein